MKFDSENPTISVYSADEAGKIFGLLSEEYDAAKVYFLGPNNSLIKPYVLTFGYYDDTESVEENLEKISSFSENWQTILVLDSVDMPLVDKAKVAKWVSSKGVFYNFWLTTNDDSLLGQAPNAVLEELEENKISGVTPIFGTSKHGALAAGYAASVNWDAYRGRRNFMGISQDGLAPSITNGANAKNLLAKGVSFYGKYAEANAQFNLLNNGAQYGRYLWTDTYLNAIWLHSALRVSIMQMFMDGRCNPYNADGETMIYSCAIGPIRQAINNGVIVLGVSLDQAQRASVNSEAGFDIATEIEANGFYFQINMDAPNISTIRQERSSPVCNLWYTDGGNIQKINVSVTTIL
jgi:Protein of unknown function (DUF3383)